MIKKKKKEEIESYLVNLSMIFIAEQRVEFPSDVRCTFSSRPSFTLCKKAKRSFIYRGLSRHLIEKEQKKRIWVGVSMRSNQSKSQGSFFLFFGRLSETDDAPLIIFFRLFNKYKRISSPFPCLPLYIHA